MSLPLYRISSLHTFSDEAIGTAVVALTGGNTPAAAVWPAANDALFIPFALAQSVLLKRLFVINGATASGNVDAGLYADDGTRIVSSGSTAQSGTSAPQFFDITDIIISPGRYYLAVAMDTTGGTLFRSNPSVIREQQIGMAKQASAFPLPATATFATVTALYLPCVGAEVTKVT